MVFDRYQSVFVEEMMYLSHRYAHTHFWIRDPFDLISKVLSCNASTPIPAAVIVLKYAAILD